MGYCTAVTNPYAKQRVDICKVIRKLNRPGNVHIQLLHEKIMLLQKWFDQIVKLEYPVAKRVNASTIVTRSQNFRQLPLVCASPRHHTVSVFKNWNTPFPHIMWFPLTGFSFMDPKVIENTVPLSHYCSLICTNLVKCNLLKEPA